MPLRSFANFKLVISRHRKELRGALKVRGHRSWPMRKSVTGLISPKKTVRSRGNTKSSLISIISGIAQGSILRPLFLKIFTNDLPNSNVMKTILFADDTVLVQRTTIWENYKT